MTSLLVASRTPRTSPANECQIMNLLLPAIEKAGKKLTWAKVATNLRKTTKAPAIYSSNGEGWIRSEEAVLRTTTCTS